jgi:DNA polymerase-3 subunit alpha
LSAYGYDMKVINHIAKTVPDKVDSIKTCMEAIPEFMFAMKGKEKEYQDMLTLEGLMSHTSMHAAGVAIANQPIYNIVPCMTSSEDRTMLITQWHKKLLELVGVFKFDILGLKTLTVLDMTRKLIKKNKGIDISLSDIDINDPRIYAFLREGHLAGVFQFDAPAGKQALEKIQVTCFNDVVAGESLCRPGVKEAELYYNNRKLVLEGKEYKKTGDKIVDNILSETYGAIVYQEQTMLLMNKLTGGRWTLGKADKMRKVKDLEEYREDFVKCCVANEYNDEFANYIYNRFDLGYTFNKSHAAAYAVRSIQCAYFSCFYPVEFMTALMSIDVLGDGKDVPRFIQECKRRQIRIMPPDINKSSTVFTCEGDVILYPLTGIAHVGENAVKHIMENRPFTSLNDFLSKVEKKKVNKRTVKQLIKAGAFDEIENEKYRGNRALQLNDYMASVKETPNQMTWCTPLLMQYELDTLGFNLTVHPLDGYKVRDISDVPDGSNINTCFLIKEIRPLKDRNGNDMAFIEATNQYNTVTLVMFNREFAKFKNALVPMLKVAVEGKKENDNIIVNKLSII